jgi:hypothetical protein
MAEGRTFQIKHGLLATIGTLSAAELGVVTDTGAVGLYVGDGAANHAVAMVEGTTFTGAVVPSDHGTATNPEMVAVVYGTGSPPIASTTPIGSLFVKYTA